MTDSPVTDEAPQPDDPIADLLKEVADLKALGEKLAERVALLEGVAHNTHTLDEGVVEHIANHTIQKMAQDESIAEQLVFRTVQKINDHIRARRNAS